MESFLGLYNYWIVIFLMMTGFYIVIARENLIKTIIGLNIFQTAVFLLYITMGKIHTGTAPILRPGETHEHHSESATEHAAAGSGQLVQHVGFDEDVIDAAGHAVESTVYSNPLPSVLMLTAIVVGIATTALALALIVRIREDYGTIEENEILELDRNS
jgi:multicomponent Na+:H+ antiporter subunit C